MKDLDLYQKKILDFGCGIGSSSPMFHPQNYLGIDCDATRIAYAKRLYRHYKFRVSSENHLPVSDQSIDYIFIMAVLHHIPSQQLSYYLEEFHKILKPNGKVIVIEPCFLEKSYLNNWCMSTFDKGKYIRNESDYLRLFHSHQYQINVLKRFKKCFLYNELFFIATPY